MSTAELPRVSHPRAAPAEVIADEAGGYCASIWSGSVPSSFGATNSCKIASTAGGTHEGFAETDEAFVSVNPYPDQIAEFNEADGL